MTGTQTTCWLLICWPRRFPPVFLAPSKRWRIAAQAAYRPLLVSPAVATAGAGNVNMVSDAVDADRHRCPLGNGGALPVLPLSSNGCTRSGTAPIACNEWAPHRQGTDCEGGIRAIPSEAVARRSSRAQHSSGLLQMIEPELSHGCLPSRRRQLPLCGVCWGYWGPAPRGSGPQ